VLATAGCLVRNGRVGISDFAGVASNCVFSETYMAGRLLVGADLRAARGVGVQAREPAGSEIRPYQQPTSSGTMSDPALRQSVISATTQRRSG